jgi:hypothetical protein
MYVYIYVINLLLYVYIIKNRIFGSTAPLFCGHVIREYADTPWDGMPYFQTGVEMMGMRTAKHKKEESRKNKRSRKRTTKTRIKEK